MEWMRVRIDYYSDNLKKTKEEIMNIFSDLGINEVELIDYFQENKLDFQREAIKNSTWSIIAYVINNRFANIKLKMILEETERLSDSGNNFIYDIYTDRCKDNEWLNEWKKYFHTTKISDRIVVKPSWEEYETEEDEIVIKIDPGMAFGTGTHETTLLCIRMLEKYVDKNTELLDIGCGSGILMIAASKLGAALVDGIDIDPVVKEVAIKNLNDNKIDGYRVLIGNLVDDIDRKYNLVVSNILSDTLIELLESIEKVLEKDSKVIFSGILAEKKERVLEEARKYSLEKIDEDIQGEWISYVFEYRNR